MPRTLSSMAELALSHRETVEASYHLARMVLSLGVPGDLVECGVFAGAQSAAMAKALMDSGQHGRKVHLFDSFEGIPAGGPMDSGWEHPAGTSACPLDQVREYMRMWEIDERLLVYHPGYFENTVPLAEIGQIAVLRLDGDLYESTRVCMVHLYPKLSCGGWCIADDWQLEGCRAAIERTIGQPGPIYWRKCD